MRDLDKVQGLSPLAIDLGRIAAEGNTHRRRCEERTAAPHIARDTQEEKDHTVRAGSLLPTVRPGPLWPVGG